MFETDNVDYVRMPLATGFDIETRDISGNTYLLMATKNNQVETAKLLLENKADVNSVNSEGNTALILSTYNTESCDMTELLLQQNDLHIEHKNNKGYTALMSAIECKNLNAIKLLIDSGVMFHTDWEVSDFDTTEETAENLANKNHLFNFVKLLQLQKLNGISPIDEVALNKDVQSLTLFTGNNFIKFKKENVSFSDLICRYITSKYRQTKRGQPFFEQTDYVILQILCKNLTVDQSREKCLDRAIELATKHGDKMVIEILCQSGVIVSNKALGIAATKGDVTMLNFLLRFEVKINKFTSNGKSKYYHSALQKSLDNGQYETAKILIRYGAVTDVKEILHVSVQHNSKKCLDFLSKEYKREAKLAIAQLKDILHVCLCLNNRLESKTDQTLLWLIQNGARSVNKRDSKRRTLLMKAAKGVYTRLLEVLINAGANVNLRDNDGQTALDKAIYKDRPSNVEFLVRHGANINDGSAISTFCEWGQSKKILTILLKNKNNINIKDYHGNTMAMCMIQNWKWYSSLDNLKLLLSKNRNINHQNKFGKTALILSACSQYPEIMKLLIQRGADINAVSKPPNCHSALRTLLKRLWYYQNYSVQYLNILLDHGMDVRTIPSESIHILIASGSLSIVPRFISVGLGPSSFRIPNEISSLFQWPSLVSPFGVAVLVDNLELARYLYDISFFTQSDLQIWSDRPKVINQCMISSPNCVNFLLDISVQPLSLQTLSLIAVSDCLGCDLSRSEKIKLTGLPILLQDCLLHKHSSITLQDSSQKHLLMFKTALIQAGVCQGDGDDIYYGYY